MEAERQSVPNRGERRRATRNDLRSLLRLRWVQGVLVAAVVVPVAGAIGEAPDSAGSVASAVGETITVPLEPTSSYVSEAWVAQATEREAERIAGSYRAQGFRISDQLKADIVEAATRHEIDLEIAFGLIRAESSFRNAATSPVGATGLTQLMPRTAAWIAPGTTRADLRDQRTNLDVGFRYLRYLTDKYEGDENLALLAYNRGQGTVDRALRQGRNPDNGYAAFVRGEVDHGHTLYTRDRR